MIDVTVLDVFIYTSSKTELPDDAKATSREENFLTKLKKLFTNIVKSAIHRDSNAKLSLPLKLPYFITFISVCEVLMYFFSTKNLRDILIYNPTKKCDLWRFLTYILLHKDYIHLGLNIVIQFLLASSLELEQGHFRTAAIYVGGGLAGSLGASIFDNNSKLVGASGGIYALLISQISHIILNYKSLKYVFYRSLAVSVMALADVAYICYHIYVFNNESPRISLAAHFAGALSGLLLGAAFFQGTVKWTNHIHITSAIIVIILLKLAIMFNLMRTTKC